ncbi:arsenite efflux MFS transporter ArsK [Ensifer soli]|uniref:arsenite efflux MFS transporter ArsK n=1 Tax=Ciceribacter sp. sgz301302 TaxID=3342379 RepID=UPI0035BB3A5A
MSERLPVEPILALGLTQIISYGSLYYSFSILAPQMAADLGWSREWIFGALSIALLIGGLSAPWLGAGFDRYGAGRVMTLGSALASTALIACALASNGAVYLVALIAIQTAANLVQYGAAFALLVQLHPQSAQRSITYLTLIAGFASTIFWPLTSVLHEALSWQQVYMVFAAMNLAVCLPLHAWLARQTTVGQPKSAVTAAPVVGVLPPARRKRGFILLALAFALQYLVSAAILVHMLPLLVGLGLGASAALIGAMFGPSQVASRLINMLFGQSLPPLRLALIAALFIGGSVLLLTATGSSASGAMVFALLFGMGNGLLSIVSGTVPLALFGSDGYGTLQGKLMAVRLIISATAPFILAYTMEHLGIAPSLAISVSAGAVAIVLICVLQQQASARRFDRSQHDP